MAESCAKEKLIDELNDWKNGKPGIPGAEARMLSIEGKLKDNGELGIMTKVSKLWEKHINYETTNENNKESKAIRLLVALTLLSVAAQVLTIFV